MSHYIFFNEKLLENETNVISIHDRGLRYGDGLFETLRVFRRKIYQWSFHIARLKNGLQTLGIYFDDWQKLNEIVQKVVDINNIEEGILKIIITAGEKSQGYLRANNNKPNLIVEASQNKISYKKPVEVIISQITKPAISSFPVNLKTLSSINSVMAKNEAHKKNYFDAIQLDEKNIICEFSSGNIFWKKEEEVYTPSNKCSIIQGSIRDKILKLSPIKVTEGEFKISNLKEAEEIFLTNVNHIVLPISYIENLWEGKKFDFSEKLFNLILADIKR